MAVRASEAASAQGLHKCVPHTKRLIKEKKGVRLARRQVMQGGGVRIKVSERPGEIGRRRKEAGIFSFTSFPSVYDTLAINERSA